MADHFYRDRILMNNAVVDSPHFDMEVLYQIINETKFYAPINPFEIGHANIRRMVALLVLHGYLMGFENTFIEAFHNCYFRLLLLFDCYSIVIRFNSI